jgi:hypothetical protein
VLQVSLLSRKLQDRKVHAHGKLRVVVELLTVTPRKLLLWKNVAALWMGVTQWGTLEDELRNISQLKLVLSTTTKQHKNVR